MEIFTTFAESRAEMEFLALPNLLHPPKSHAVFCMFWPYFVPRAFCPWRKGLKIKGINRPLHITCLTCRPFAKVPEREVHTRYVPLFCCRLAQDCLPHPWRWGCTYRICTRKVPCNAVSVYIPFENRPKSAFGGGMYICRPFYGRFLVHTRYVQKANHPQHRFWFPSSGVAHTQYVPPYRTRHRLIWSEL